MGNTAASSLAPIRDAAANRLRVYSNLVQDLDNALRTRSESLVENAFRLLLNALIDDMCCVDYDNQKREAHDQGIFATQIAVRCLVLGSSLLARTAHAVPDDAGHALVHRVIIGKLGHSWTQSFLSSANVFAMLSDCLTSTLFGPSVHRLVVVISLILFGYDANFGDLLGPTAAPIPGAIALDRELIAQWKADQRRNKNIALDRPGFPAIFVPKPRDCRRVDIKIALERQASGLRSVFGSQTNTIQLLLGALFRPSTTVAMRLMFIRVLCLLGTEYCNCEQLIAQGAFRTFAMSLSHKNPHVQLDVVQSVFKLVTQLRLRPRHIKSDVTADSYRKNKNDKVEIVTATELKVFLEKENESSTMRRIRQCLASQLAPTLFFRIVANDSFLVDKDTSSLQSEHRSRVRRKWRSNVHCLLSKLTIDILADVAAAAASSVTLSKLQFTADATAFQILPTNGTQTKSFDRKTAQTANILQSYTALHLFCQRLSESIEWLRTAERDQHPSSRAVQPSEVDIQNPSVYHCSEPVVVRHDFSALQVRYFESLALLVTRLLANTETLEIALRGSPSSGVSPISNLLHVIGEALHQSELLEMAGAHNSGVFRTTHLSLFATFLSLETASNTVLSDQQRVQMQSYRALSQSSCLPSILPHFYSSARHELQSMSKISELVLDVDELPLSGSASRPSWWIQVAMAMSQIHDVASEFALGTASSDTVAMASTLLLRLCFYVFDEHTITSQSTRLNRASSFAGSSHDANFQFLYPLYCVKVMLEVGIFLTQRSFGAMIAVRGHSSLADAHQMFRAEICGRVEDSTLLWARSTEVSHSDAEPFLAGRHFLKSTVGQNKLQPSSKATLKITYRHLRQDIDELTNAQLEVLCQFHGISTAKTRHDAALHLRNLRQLDVGDYVLVHAPPPTSAKVLQGTISSGDGSVYASKDRGSKDDSKSFLTSLARFCFRRIVDKNRKLPFSVHIVDSLIVSLMMNLAIVTNRRTFNLSVHQRLRNILPSELTNQQLTPIATLIERYSADIGCSLKRSDGDSVDVDHVNGTIKSIATISSGCLRAVYELEDVRALSFAHPSNYPRLRGRLQHFKLSIAEILRKITNQESDMRLNRTLMSCSQTQEACALLLTLAKFAENSQFAFEIASAMHDDFVAILHTRRVFVPLHRACAILLGQLARRPSGLYLWLKFDSRRRCGERQRSHDGALSGNSATKNEDDAVDGAVVDSSCSSIVEVYRIDSGGAQSEVNEQNSKTRAETRAPTPHEVDMLAKLRSFAATGQSFGRVSKNDVNFLSIRDRTSSLSTSQEVETFGVRKQSRMSASARRTWSSNAGLDLGDEFTLTTWFRVPPPPAKPGSRMVLTRIVRVDARTGSCEVAPVQADCGKECDSPLIVSCPDATGSCEKTILLMDTPTRDPNEGQSCGTPLRFLAMKWIQSCEREESTMAPGGWQFGYHGSDGVFQGACANEYSSRSGMDDEQPSTNSSRHRKPVIFRTNGEIDPDRRFQGKTHQSLSVGDYVYVDAAKSSNSNGIFSLRDIVDARWHLLKVEYSNSCVQSTQLATMRLYCNNMTECIGTISMPVVRSHSGRRDADGSVTLKDSGRCHRPKSSVSVVGVGNSAPTGNEPSCDLRDLRIYDRISKMSSTDYTLYWDVFFEFHNRGGCAPFKLWKAHTIALDGSKIAADNPVFYIETERHIICRDGESLPKDFDQVSTFVTVNGTTWMSFNRDSSSDVANGASALLVREWEVLRRPEDEADEQSQFGGDSSIAQWVQWVPRATSTYHADTCAVNFVLDGPTWVWKALSCTESSQNSTSSLEGVRIVHGTTTSHNGEWYLGATGWQLISSCSTDRSFIWEWNGEQTDSVARDNSPAGTDMGMLLLLRQTRLRFERRPTPKDGDPLYDYDLFVGLHTTTRSASAQRSRARREVDALNRTRLLLLSRQLVDAIIVLLGGGTRHNSSRSRCDVEIAEPPVETLSCLMSTNGIAKRFVLAQHAYLPTLFRVQYSATYTRHHRERGTDVPGHNFERALEESLALML